MEGVDAERPAGARFDEERETVDRQRLPDHGRKAFPKSSLDRCGVLVGDGAGEGHVETEFVEDVWVAPAVEVLALPLGQPVRRPARQFGRVEGGSEGLELPHGLVGQGMESRLAPAGNQREEASDAVKLQLRDLGPAVPMAKVGERLVEFLQRPTLGEAKRRLNRGMETVPGGLRDEG